MDDRGVARERRTSRERLASSDRRASSDWRGYVSVVQSGMGERAEMSCATVSGVSVSSAGRPTYKGSPVRVEALARDAKGLVLAEQAAVVGRGSGEVRLGVPECGLLLVGRGLSRVSIKFAALRIHEDGAAAVRMHPTCRAGVEVLRAGIRRYR